MAQAIELKPFILRWEGGFVNDPDDHGGATNKGVTIATFRQYYGASRTVADLRALTDEQWMHIFKAGFWNPCHGDEIANQSLANIIVDWAWGSGTRNAIRRLQAAIGVQPDGIIGKITLGKLNAEPRWCFDRIFAARRAFLENIARRPGQSKFLRGWMNRLNALKWYE